MNREIADRLAGLDLAAGRNRMGDNLRRSYKALIEMGAVGPEEMGLLEGWLEDLG